MSRKLSVVNMEIVLQDKLDEKSWKHLTGWNEFVFPKEGKGMEWAPLGWHVLAFEGTNPIAHIGFDRFSINDSGETIWVVGVGGVVVRPEFQKKGIPAELFKKLHTNCPPSIFSESFTLFCPERLVPYYQKHGYEKVERSVKVIQFGQLISTNFTFMARGTTVQKKGSTINLFGPPW
ncbi:MAG: GNAT family N-acetyltransferase [Elusimicrobiota bacterium]